MSDPRKNGFNAPRDATLVITFTEAVDVFGAWFDITCAASGQHNSATFAGGGQTHYITPNVDFIAGETCTVTVFKDQIHDQDLDDVSARTRTRCRPTTCSRSRWHRARRRHTPRPSI